MWSSMRKTLAVGRKEFRQIARDRRSLMVLLFVPAFFLLLYGYALSFDVQNIQLAVQDNDRSQASRDLVNAFVKSGYFELAADVSSSREYEELIDRGDVRAALVIPPGLQTGSSNRPSRSGAGHHQRRQLEYRDDGDGLCAQRAADGLGASIRRRPRPGARHRSSPSNRASGTTRSFEARSSSSPASSRTSA